MSNKFKNMILNDWNNLNHPLVDSLQLLRKIILSCYDLGEETGTPTIIHFKDENTDTLISLSIADGIPSIRFEFNQSTAGFFNAVFKCTSLTYDELSELSGDDIALVLDMFSDDYHVRKQNLMFCNFSSVGGCLLSVYLDPIDESVVDLIVYLLSKNGAATLK
jgi:hypothetical protein